MSGPLVNPHAHRIDRQQPLGDPGSDGVLLPPCDPAGVGHRYPAITRAGEFGHVYFLLGWVFWHGFTPPYQLQIMCNK